MAAAVSRLGPAFASAHGATGLIPYVTAGYPSLEASLELLLAFDRLGARAVEVGIPFSDPIADGPDIQRAAEWALRARVGMVEALELVARLRARSQLPVVVMTYANPALRGGAEDFARRARAAGVDGVLISDLPPEESPEVWAALDREGLDTVTLVAPTTDDARLPRLLARARGFVFGIADAMQARALRGVADAIVVGAAFMRAVAEDPARGVVERVGGLAAALVEALS